VEGTQSGEFVTRVEDVIAPVDDWRVCSKDELVGSLWYLVYGYNEELDSGGEWSGVTFSQRDLLTLMISKRVHDGVPQVVFITGRSPMDCMRMFQRRWFEGSLNWVRDKFR